MIGEKCRIVSHKGKHQAHRCLRDALIITKFQPCFNCIFKPGNNLSRPIVGSDDAVTVICYDKLMMRLLNVGANV